MDINGNERSMSRPAKLMIWCLPTLLLLLVGVFGIGLIPTLPSLVMILLVGLIVTRLIFLFCSRRKSGVKAALIMIWFVISAGVGFGSLFVPWEFYYCDKEEAFQRFESQVSGIFPEVLTSSFDAGNVSAAEFHTYIVYWAFDSRAYTLLCSYDEDEYGKALVSMEEHFSFRTEPLGTGRLGIDHVETKTEPHMMNGNDFFRIVFPENGNDEPFYKESMLIMKNDEKHQIAYIVFYDFNLDEVESLEEFINSYCGWKHIRRFT